MNIIGNALNPSGVTPASVTFQNNTAAYVLTGTAGITGPTGITLNGLGSVTILTANSNYGTTTLNSGLLVLGNSSALGSAAQGGAFTINGGSLDAIGGALTTDDYAINWNGPFTFVGTNPLTLGNGSQLSVVTLGVPRRSTLAAAR